MKRFSDFKDVHIDFLAPYDDMDLDSTVDLNDICGPIIWPDLAHKSDLKCMVHLHPASTSGRSISDSILTRLDFQFADPCGQLF